jgi:hypothetical protein
LQFHSLRVNPIFRARNPSVFYQGGPDFKHFDVIGSCLQKMRKRTGRTRLVKIKSHSGLLMNDRADALAKLVRVCEEPPRWPPPLKADQLCTSVRSSVLKIHSFLPDVIFVCVQPYSTTLPFPLPTPQGAGIGNSGTGPRPRFEGCARQPSGQRATAANLLRMECQG